MTFLIIGVILGSILSAFLLWYSEQGYNGRHTLSGVLGGLSAFICLFGVIAICVCGFAWQASKVQAGLLNREYGTNYTREEVFYASNVIDIIRELDRNRYEVNGDLRRERDPQRDKHQK